MFAFFNEVVPKSHSSGHGQPQCCRLAATSGGGQSHGAPQSLLRNGLDELQHTFGLKEVTEAVGIVNGLAIISYCSMTPAYLVHSPAAVH